MTEQRDEFTAGTEGTDVEGHLVRQVPDEDVEGHRNVGGMLPDDDDVEGHKLARGSMVQPGYDEDDVAGHLQR